MIINTEGEIFTIHESQLFILGTEPDSIKWHASQPKGCVTVNEENKNS